MEMVWDWKSITSLLATIVFIRSAARDFLPPELRNFLHSVFTRLYASVRPTATLIIDEFDTAAASTNELFEATLSYLSSRCLATAPVLRLSKTTHSKILTSSLPPSHSATDHFGGVHMKWCYHAVDRPSGSSNPFSTSSRSEHRYFELSFHRRHREMVHNRYVQHILDEAALLKLRSRERRLYTNRPFVGGSGDDHHGLHWSSVPFRHPSTFDTLAIDPALRDSIRSDLLRFRSRRDYYARVGRAWKRGYLLHGPPGTGKTSLIAAIANFLEFDLYDLELTAVNSNTQLRKLLVSTSAKSVIVVEDVDCSLDLSDRKKKYFKKLAPPSPANATIESENEDGCDSPRVGASSVACVSLSGVLNFVDGLWSSCVGERLMIFTTNHPERLDPALLRPGRMDRKIHLSYCEPAAFRLLAKNYLEIEGRHELMEVAEAMLEKVKVTPADIAEVFMGCDGQGGEVGMRKVVDELRQIEKAMASLAETEDGGCLSVKKEEEVVCGSDEEEVKQNGLMVVG